MGKNVERLDRLQNNRADFAVVVVRTTQSVQRAAASEAVDTVAANVQKAARTEAFEGKFGMTVAEALTKIRKDLVSFGEYQAALNTAIAEADEALQQTASGTSGLPGTGLSAEQQNTIDMAAKTDSPVQVSPGVTMTPAQAQQHYLDQAAAAQEEEARKLADALDQRLQEIIDGMPTSDYDEHKPTDEPKDGEGPGGRTPIDYPGVNGGGGSGGGGNGSVGGGSVIDGGGNGGGGGGNGGNGNDNDNGTIGRPPIIREPPVNPPVIEEPPFPRPRDDDPRIDGGIGGEIPGVGPGGNGAFPGGTTGGGAGSVGAGVGGVVGGAGLAGGAALANRLSGGAGLIAGGVGGVGGAGGAGAPGAAGVVAQSGAAAGGRGGAMAGGAMAGGAGRADKRNRRRGQDLMAFEVEADDDESVPDMGSAGAAGRSTSEGREELGW